MMNRYSIALCCLFFPATIHGQQQQCTFNKFQFGLIVDLARYSSSHCIVFILRPYCDSNYVNDILPKHIRSSFFTSVMLLHENRTSIDSFLRGKNFGNLLVVLHVPSDSIGQIFAQYAENTPVLDKIYWLSFSFKRHFQFPKSTSPAMKFLIAYELHHTDRTFSIRYAFHDYEQGLMSTRDFGIWDTVSRLKTKIYAENCCFHLKGLRLRAVSMGHSVPYITMNRKMGISNSSAIDGFLKEAVHVIEETLDIRFDIYPVPDGIYGDVDGFGKASGLFRELQMNRADIALGGISITEGRMKIAEFSPPLFETWVSAAYLADHDLGAEHTLSLYFNPFTTTSWVCIIVIVFTELLLTYIFRKFTPKNANDNLQIFDQFGAFCNQTVTMNLTSCSLFCMVMCSWVTAVLLSIYYGSKFVSLTTIDKEPLPFSGLLDLAKHKSITPLLVNGTSIWSTIQTSGDLEYSALYERINKNKSNHLFDSFSIEKLIGSGRYAIIDDILGLKHYQTVYDMHILKEKYMVGGIHLAWNKNSKYSRLLEMNENGLTEVSRRRYFTLKPELTIESKLKSIELHEASLPFAIVISGTILSLIAKFVELFIKRYEQQTGVRNWFQKSMSSHYLASQRNNLD